jgi:hypothetical protein
MPKKKLVFWFRSEIAIEPEMTLDGVNQALVELQAHGTGEIIEVEYIEDLVTPGNVNK